MKNRELKLQHYPTTAELYAFVRAAKAARAAEMARLVRAAARSLIRQMQSLLADTGETRGLKHA